MPLADFMRRVRPALPRSALVALLSLSLGSTAWGVTPLPRFDNDYLDSEAHVFRDDELALIEITMSQEDLDSFHADPWQDEYKLCTVHFVNSLVDVVIDSVGIRVRGNTSRAAIKKSWKLSFDEFVPGRQFHGIERLNLNGEHNDITALRSRLAWDLMNELEIPSSRANHVRLKINDGSLVEGVYANIEQIDEEFVEAWFGNKHGNLYKCLYKGSRADLGYVWPGDGNAYRWLGDGQTYEEKNNLDADYEDLAAFIDFINNAGDADFTTGISQRLNVDDFLRAMAVDVVIGNWDNYWYGANNFYFYHNQDTGRFEYIPYDLDNTFGVDFFGIDWAYRQYAGWGNGGYGSNDGQLPVLIRRLLSVPVFEEQLRRYVRLVASEHCTSEQMDGRVDELRAQIEPWIYNGSFLNGNMDWGYTLEMFQQSFDQPEYYEDNWGGWDHGLKPYVAQRAASLLATVNEPAPLPPLVINEFLADNEAVNRDETGAYEDWLEIYNAGSEPIELGGMFLTDDLAWPTKWMLPDTVIAGGGFVLVWCDDDLGDGPLHAGFKLSRGGEEIGLSGPVAAGNPLLDYHVYYGQSTDRSEGRLPDGGLPWVPLPVPSPGATNDTVSPVPAAAESTVVLGPSRPNPFNAGTTLRFTLPHETAIVLEIYDLNGRLVTTLVDETLAAGEHTVKWNGRDKRGRPLASGVYLSRLRAGAERHSGRLVLVK